MTGRVPGRWRERSPFREKSTPISTVGILRHVVRRPSPFHFATSTSNSRFLLTAVEAKYIPVQEVKRKKKKRVK